MQATSWEGLCRCPSSPLLFPIHETPGAQGWRMPLEHPWAVGRQGQASQHPRGCRNSFCFIISDSLFHFPDVNRRAGIFAGKDVKYLQALSNGTFFPTREKCLASPRWMHYAYSPLCNSLTWQRATSSLGAHSPAQVLHLLTICFSFCRVLEGHVTELLHPHLNAGRGTENSRVSSSFNLQHSS